MCHHRRGMSWILSALVQGPLLQPALLQSLPLYSLAGGVADNRQEHRARRRSLLQDLTQSSNSTSDQHSAGSVQGIGLQILGNNAPAELVVDSSSEMVPVFLVWALWLAYAAMPFFFLSFFRYVYIASSSSSPYPC